jgi:hypothetical protein
MKRLMICCVAALAILWAGNVGLAKDRTERREQRKMTREDKRGPQKSKATTPEQRKVVVAMAKKAIKKDLAFLRQTRETAVAEKATRTVAKIDRAIAAQERQSRKLASLGEKRKAGRKGEAALGNRSHAQGKAGDKKPKKNDK